MTTPTSSDFDLFDWNSRYATTTDTGDRSIVDTVDGFLLGSITTNGVFEMGSHLAVAAMSAAGGSPSVQSAVVDGVQVPDSFTLEFDLSLTADLPKDFTDPHNRLYIGAVNQQGYSAGLLFSYQGIAVVSSADDASPTVLGNSASVLFNSDGTPKDSVTIRVVLDGTTGRISIYAADTASAYAVKTNTAWADYGDLTLLWNVVAPTQQTFSGDLVSIVAKAHGGVLAANTVASVTSFRMASTTNRPSARPTAEITAPRHESVGAAVQVSAGQSFDSLGAQLSFVWDILVKPEGSAAKMSSGSYSTAQTGAEANDNQLLFSARSASSDFNEWSLVVSEGSKGSNLSIVVNEVGKQLEVSLAKNTSGTVTTTADDMIAAFTVPGAGGYSPLLVEMFNCELVDFDATNIGAPETGTFAFAGGAGSTDKEALFLPDLPGLYTLRLVVNNGSLDSTAVLHVVEVQQTDQLLGHRPDTDFIWLYLSDYWKLVDGKNVISDVWSAAAQAVAADLTQYWQEQLSRSIRDIPRLYQRRWVKYPLYTEYEGVTSIVHPSARGRFDVSVSLPSEGTDVVSGTVAVDEDISPIELGPILVRSDRFESRVSNALAMNREGAGWTLVTNGLPAAELLFEKSAGYWVRDPDAAVASPQPTTHFYDESFAELVPSQNLRIRTYEGAARTGGTLHTVSSYTSTRRFITGTTETVTGIPLLWDLLYVPQWLEVEVTSYLQLDASFVSSLQAGDYLLLELDFGDVNPTEVRVPIIAIDGGNVFVDWTSLFSSLESVASAVGLIQEASGFELLEQSTVRVVGSYLSRDLAAIEDLDSVPGMSTDTVQTDLYSGRDYSVSGNAVHLTPLVAGEAEVIEGSSDIRIVPGAKFHPDARDASISELNALGGYSVIVKTGDAGTYPLVSVSEGVYRVDRPLGMTGTVDVEIRRYSASSPSGDNLWAELSYFDNSKAIERNFGILVGLPRSVLEVPGARLDYLTAVRSMAYAFVMGPTLSNMQQAVQSLFGLPSTEKRGLIVSIEEPVDERNPGRITILNEDDTVHTFGWEFGWALATNKGTQRQYRAVDPDIITSLNASDYDVSFATWRAQRVDSGWPIEDVLTSDFDALWEQWADARVEPWSQLVDVVRVDDYISDPALIDSTLTGGEMVRRYHTFVVDVPLTSTGTSAIFPTIRAFLDSAKPAHTNYILYGSIRLSDSISVTDTTTNQVTFIPVDTIHTSPLHILDGHSSADVYPDDETLARHAGAAGAWDASDVFEKYESSYACGFADDYSGDGSHNARQAELHMVNQADGDIDVCMSTLWVPVVKDTAGGQVDLEFQTGEEVEILDAGVLQASIFDESPPIIARVGVGEHPKLPFGVYAPQNVHPNTYLVLSFNNPNYATASNLGDVERLDEMNAMYQSLGTCQLRGKTSGAIATVSNMVARDHADADLYYQVEYIFRADRYTEHSPEIRAFVGCYIYIPVAGMTLKDFQDAAGLYTSSNGDNVHRQMQVGSYDPSAADDDQYVPSFNPGFFTDFDLSGESPDIGGGAADTSNYLVRWGYREEGAQTTFSSPVTDFIPDPTTDPLENVHVGIIVRAHKDIHYTHGVIDIQPIPGPVVLKTTFDASLATLRIEGNFFIDVDPTQTVIPNYEDETTFDGTKGGCWVYFVNRDTDIAYPVGSVTFETGLSAGRTVLGLDGATQTSTGHVLDVPVPGGLPGGFYDIVVRNFRPYYVKSGGTRQVFYEDAVAFRGYFEATGTGSGAAAGAILGEGALGVDGHGA
jgi:hypothetical protein